MVDNGSLKSPQMNSTSQSLWPLREQALRHLQYCAVLLQYYLCCMPYMLRYDCEANVVYISKYTASPNKAIGLPSDLTTAWSYIDDGRVGSQRKVFDSTFLGFLMGLSSGLWWAIHMEKWCWNTLSQTEPNKSWHCHHGIRLLEKKKSTDGKPGHSVYSGILNFFRHITLNLRLTNWSDSRSQHCPHIYDGCITVQVEIF